ncbi:CalU12 protein [Neorhizobium galegae bv. officinalis]|uniref:CalU12 protein n=1 Tax=Neorhizobium galegae bv. officinalis TaxID=323656 RepID=A0A0T7F872_NEOGA|nr:thioredoxin family protein [Neorhizobium galegae]CDZ31274.1 CalU12 protein [Neorhizobium galegae bv. officinalis]
MDVTMSPKNPVVSREEWLEARRKLLALEKEETHLRDKVRAERQAMPWVKVDKDYVFDTQKGKKSLADLFDGRSQLIVYHFMLGPDWDAGCPGCSFLSDHIDGTLPHLNNHDVTFIAVARAPLDKIEAYKKRMGWKFPWVSSFGSDFNFDYHVSFSKEDLAKEKVYYNFREVPPSEAHDELPGLSAFYRNEAGEVFHTYSSYARGGEELIGTLMILDRAPLGRNEDSTMNFVKRHDEYEQKPQETASSCCH